MRKILFCGFICVLLAGSAFAQKTKPWSEWSKKDADKMLNDSAWAQSELKGEAPPDAAPQKSGSGQGGPQTIKDQSGDQASPEIHLRIRFISARPIREAFGRKVLLAQPEPPKELQDQVQAFVDRDFGDLIVVGVNVDGASARNVGAVVGALARLTTAQLAEKAFLERKDGKRIPLVEYRAPSADGMGGKFIFARTLDGQPFLTADSGSVRFVLKLKGNLDLEAKFKVSGMMYGEKLEY